MAIECKGCKNESINVGVTKPTIKGFTVHFKKCPICGYIYTDEDIEEFFENMNKNKQP